MTQSKGGVMLSRGEEWLTVREAAAHARCGVKTLYREVAAGRLRAARVGGRRALRFRAAWIDTWIEAAAMGGTDVAERDLRL